MHRVFHGFEPSSPVHVLPLHSMPTLLTAFFFKIQNRSQTNMLTINSDKLFQNTSQAPRSHCTRQKLFLASPSSRNSPVNRDDNNNHSFISWAISLIRHVKLGYYIKWPLLLTPYKRDRNPVCWRFSWSAPQTTYRLNQSGDMWMSTN